MVLYIRTQDQKLVEVALEKNREMVDSLSEQNEYGSQVLLPLIENLLQKNNIELKDLTSIEVETGPGSFVGIRVGVSVANALAFALGIPVNGKKVELDVQY